MDLSKLNRRTFLQASAAAGLAAAVERIPRAFPGTHGWGQAGLTKSVNLKLFKMIQWISS